MVKEDHYNESSEINSENTRCSPHFLCGHIHRVFSESGYEDSLQDRAFPFKAL
jgi:hypothetical protein